MIKKKIKEHGDLVLKIKKKMIILFLFKKLMKLKIKN
jgi:hypothetical protein